MLYSNLDTFYRSVELGPEHYAVVKVQNSETDKVNYKIIDLTSNATVGALPKDYSGPISKFIKPNSFPRLILDKGRELPTLFYDNYKENDFGSLVIDKKGYEFLSKKIFRVVHKSESDADVSSENAPLMTQREPYYRELSQQVGEQAFCIFGNSPIEKAQVVIIPDLNHAAKELPQKRADIIDAIPSGSFLEGRVFLLEGGDQSDVMSNSLNGTNEVFKVNAQKDNIAFWDDKELIVKHIAVARTYQEIQRMQTKYKKLEADPNSSEKEKAEIQRVINEMAQKAVAEDHSLTDQRTGKIIEAIEKWKDTAGEQVRIYLIGGGLHFIDRGFFNTLFQKAISFAYVCTDHKAQYEMTEEELYATKNYLFTL